MTGSTPLSDHQTPRAWQASNLIGWAALALFIAFIGHALFDAVASAWLSGCCGVGNLTAAATAQDAAATAGQFALRGLLSLLIAVAVGSVISEYVATRPVGTASTVATIYATVAIVVLSRTGGAAVTESVALGPDGNELTRTVWPPHPWMWAVGYALVILVTIPTTYLITRRLVRT